MDYEPISSEELAELQRRFEQANLPPARDEYMRREWKRVMRETVPRRTRFRLWRHKRLTVAGLWLIDHGHTGAAEALWRVTGLC